MSFPTIYHALPIGGASSLSGLSDRGEPSGKSEPLFPLAQQISLKSDRLPAAGQGAAIGSMMKLPFHRYEALAWQPH